MQQNDYFKGWYFKCSNENKTIAFILDSRFVAWRIVSVHSFFLFFTQVISLQKFRIVLNYRKGRFYLMGYVGKKVRFQSLNAAKFLHHFIEVHDHHIKPEFSDYS